MLKTLYDAITLHQADIACCNFVQVLTDGTQKKECDKIVPGAYTTDQYWEKSFASIPRTYSTVLKADGDGFFFFPDVPHFACDAIIKAQARHSKAGMV